MTRKLFASLFAVLMLGAVLIPTAALAAPSFTFVPDDQGADDEPGQKDLTAQSSDLDGSIFYTAWKWDDTSWSGKNTGDGCSLFDTNDDGLVEYALCATVGGGQGPAAVQLQSFSLYSCNNTRADRCAGPTLLVSKTGADAATYCTVHDSFSGQFSGVDTEIECDISDLAALANITTIGDGSLLNTCSYPSREPNSDPSDCVLTIIPDDTTTVTTPSGSATFTATLNDSAQITPAAAGNVVFALYLDDPATTGACNAAEQVFIDSTNATDASGVASTTTSVTVAGTYNWTADFTPTDPAAFNPSASACGSETVIVTAPSVN